MAGSWFEVRLDTHGPAVGFGAIAGATGGELLQLAYTSDEPIASATLVHGSRRLALTVHADRLEAQLPVSWPDGLAAIEVLDDVDNATTYADVVDIDSVATGAGGAIGGGSSGFGTGGGGFAEPYRPVVHVAVGRSRGVARSSSRVDTRQGRRIRASVAARTAVLPVALRARASASTVSRSTVRTGRTHATATTGVTRATVVRRRDGPELEALLLAL